MDLSKLTPWRLAGPADLAGRVGQGVEDQDGIWVAGFRTLEDATRAVLAAAAFDVMMRRGWEPYRKDNGAWFVAMKGILDGTNKYFELLRHAPEGWPDPFSCLVSADQWMASQGK